MSLTAARTELQIVLQGQDETQRIIEQAQQRMAALDAEVRRLTASINGQGGAAGPAGAATDSWSQRIAAATGAINSGQERLEGFIGKIKGFTGLFGDIGDIVSGTIDAYKFLKETFDDNAKAAKKLEEELAKQKEQLEQITQATKELTAAQEKANAVLASSGSTLLSERLKLAQLEKDTALEKQLQEELIFQQQNERVEQYKTQIEEVKEQHKKAHDEMRDAAQKLGDTEKFIASERREILESEAEIRRLNAKLEDGVFRTNADTHNIKALIRNEEEKISIIKKSILQTTENILNPEKLRLDTASRTASALSDQRRFLFDMLDVASKIANKLKPSDGVLQMDVLDESKPTRPRGGGGGGRAKAGPHPEDVERERLERAKRLQDTRLQLFEDDLRDEQARQRRIQKEMLGEENVAATVAMREKIVAELAKLPTDATAKAFEPLKAELEKQLKALDAVTESHVKYTVGAMVFTDEQDKVIDAWEKEQQAIDKVKEAVDELAETQKKAAQEAAKMREELARAVPADFFEGFSGPLEQLGQIATPAFEAVGQAVSGITAQLAKYKEGQQGLTASLIGSSGAIAGAIAKQVGGVKEEAAVRAIFEGAMGFATMFTNPAQSVGHFTAATMFGLAAGGVIKTGGGGGGQKAKDSRPAASTRESGMIGGGGPITNVYNLQTGIIDGQSTALAFRRAEQTARNTGMASAGGW